jgi:hypothetical protein
MARAAADRDSIGLLSNPRVRVPLESRMKLPGWLEPVYVAQVLTGLAGIGAVAIDDPFTKWHALILAIIASSLVTSLVVTARAEVDARRNRTHVETLLRAMELPYFIIKAMTPLIESVARARGWTLTRQENFERETVYEFRSTGGEPGRLVVSEQEFKDLWILEDDARLNAIDARLFGVESQREHLAAVVREAIGERASGPCWIGQQIEPDGTQVFEVRVEGSASVAVRLPVSRLDQLFAMPPVRRYRAVVDDVEKALGGRLRAAT